MSGAALGCGGSSTQSGSPAGGRGPVVADSSGLVGGSGGVVAGSGGMGNSAGGVRAVAGGGSGGVGAAGSGGRQESYSNGGLLTSYQGGSGGVGAGASGGLQESYPGGSGGVIDTGACRRVMSYDVECIRAHPGTRIPEAYFCDNEYIQKVWLAGSRECESTVLPEGAHFSLCCAPL